MMVSENMVEIRGVMACDRGEGMMGSGQREGAASAAAEASAATAT